jgi:glycosyltransferase involved in cell wall biosynthesis
MNSRLDHRRVRVTVVVSHPIQYFCHTYRRLSDQPDIDLSVQFSCLMGAKPYLDHGMATCLKWETDLLSGFRWRSISNDTQVLRRRLARRVIETWRRLSLDQPDVVLLHGYTSAECRAAYFWAMLKRRRLLLFGDGNGRIERGQPLWRRVLKGLALAPMLRGFHAVLSLGEANECYWRMVGVPGSRIVHAPLYLPDPGIFAMTDVARMDHRRTVRLQVGLSDGDVVVMYSGKFQRRKRVRDLVEAVDRCPGIKCLYVGDGECRSELTGAVRHPERHRFLGFANLDRLPSLYAAADALVHPADAEPYGLVIAEAAMVGLPILSSRTTGAIGEGSHARLGRNASTFESGDVDGLVALLNALASERSRLVEMAAQSRAIAAEMHDSGLRGIRIAIGLDAVASGRSGRVCPGDGPAPGVEL